MKENENQIVVYQPDEVMRLEVRLENETVWLTQSQMCALFGRERSVITKHIKNAFDEGELTAENNVQILHNNQRGKPLSLYSLDVIISVGYRVKSIRGTQFRQCATKVLREHLLKGYTVNARLSLLEDRVDRRLSKNEADIVALKEQVDFFVKTNTPPPQGIFYEGQLWDACSFVEKLIAKAKTSILLIDSWVDVGTLDMLAKKRNGVAVEVVASKRGNKLAATDVTKFNAQYGPLTLKESAAFHDRFLIIDDKELYLIGASLKDLGKKCFGFTKMDAGEIPGIKARA